MKHQLPLLTMLLLSCLFINGQFNQNIRIQNYLKEKGNSTEIVGFFVKGNKQSIIELSEKHNGKYHSSVKGWHYVKIPANELNTFSASKAITNLTFAGPALENEGEQ